MDTLWQDLRTALRRTTKAPLFAAIVVATLALGIGASTALFTVVHAVLLRPLPYAHSERLAMVWSATSSDPQAAASYPEYLDWKAGSRSFEDMAVYRGQSVNLTGRGDPERFTGAFVSSNMLPLIGARMMLGRGFVDGETDPSTAKPVALLSHALFRGRFGSDPKVVGSSITVNGRPVTVVGVVDENMDPGRAPFDGGFMGTEVWLPVAYFPNAKGLERGQSEMLVIGRLKPGVSTASAATDLGVVADRLAKAFPETQAGRTVRVVSLAEQIVGDVRPALLTALAAALGVLLVCCINVANLFLAQTASRARELATRAALGADAGRLVRQQLTEGVVYGLVGGVGGLLLAYPGRAALVSLLPFPTGVSSDSGLDAAVLAFCLAASSLAGILVSAIPASRLGRDRLTLATQGTRGIVESKAPRRQREWLVVGQLALSLALLVGAGLLVRSARALSQVHPGFRADHLLTLQFRLPATKYNEPAQIARFFEAAQEAIRAVPGVESAALARATPFGNALPTRPFLAEGAPVTADSQLPTTQTNIVSPEYFKTMGIPLLRGREIAPTDSLQTTPVAVVNQVFANRVWPGQDPLGRRFSFKDSPWVTIVGVVGDIKHGSLTAGPTPQAYTAHGQDPKIFTEVAVRTEGDPLAFAGAVRQAIWSVDRDQPVWRVRAMDRLLEEARQPARTTALLAAVSAGVALLLSVLGLYGVLSYLVGQRTREIGVRIALGASRRDVHGLVVRHALALAAGGVVLGLIAALAWGRVLRSLLFGVAPADPPTFVGVALLLIAVATLASYIPARRAAAVDPARALRWE